jgi:hypothetical protein
MIIKEIIVARFEVNPENKTLSIRLDTVIKEEGVELSRSHHRCAYVPGDIDKVIECLGADAPEVAYLNLIWTDEVIKAYKAKTQEQENQL